MSVMMGSGHFSPLRVPGCALWIEADRGITVDGSTNVSAWADQSGNGRDFAQNTSSLRPAYTASAINGRPGVYYNAADVLVASAGKNLLRNISAMTFITVHRNTNSAGTSYQAIFVTENSTGSDFRYYWGHNNAASEQLSAVQRLDADSSQNLTLSSFFADDARVVSEVWDAANAKLYTWKNGGAAVRNGVTAGTAGSTQDADANNIYIGAADTAGSFYYQGYISFIAVWRRYITDAERQYLQFGLGRKYGITVT